MAYFKYLSETNNNCLIKAYTALLEELGLKISKEFSSSAQVFAIAINNDEKFKSQAKVIITWKNKSMRQCLIEVRTDEPSFAKSTFCERIANRLRSRIPAKE